MRPLSIGGIVGRSFALALRKLPALAAIAIAAVALLKAADWLAFRTDPFLLMAPRKSVGDSQIIATLEALPGQFIYNLGTSAAAWIVFGALDGGRSARESFSSWARALMALLVIQAIVIALSTTSFLLVEAVRGSHGPTVFLGVVGMLIWLAMFVYLTLSWWVAPVTAIAEGNGALAALRRSAALTKGNRARLLAIALILAAITIGPMFLMMRLSGAGYPPRIAVPLWTPVGAIAQALQLLFFVLFSAAAGIVYFDLRNMKDPAAQAETFA